jgi:hypothetical protein
MYLVGQWMRYRDGRLEHDPERPVVVRRLLNSFEREAGGAPLAHLRDRAEAWDGLPLKLPPLAGRLRGTVLEVRGDTVAVPVTPQRTLELFDFGVTSADPDGARTFWLVDAATGRPYPPGYASADSTWLRGAPVEIMHYRDEVEAVHLVVVGARPDGSR